MPYKKRSNSNKLFISFSKGIGAVALVILTVVGTGLLLRSYLTKNSVSQKPPSKEAPIKVALAEISEPQDASSEIAGKYYGLCKKNSIHSVEDFRKTVSDDAVLSAHFSGFNWEYAKLGKQDKDIWTYVSYRKGEIIRRTSKPIRLPKGDGYITDGTRKVRTFCCNDYDIAPPPIQVSLAAPADPVERVDAAPRHMENKSEIVAGPPRQLAFGAASEDSAGAIPEESPKSKPSPPPPIPPTPPSQVPEPGTLYLMAAGVAAFGLLRLLRRKQTKQE